MLIFTTVLIAFLIGDAIGCNKQQQQQQHCRCDGSTYSSTECVSTYTEPGYKCICRKVETSCGLVSCRYHCEVRWYLLPPCNCDKESDWTKWSYSIDKVDFDINQSNLMSVESIVLATRYIPNCSGNVQHFVISYQEYVTHTSSYSQRFGIPIHAGIAFRAKIPKIGESDVNLSFLAPYEYKYGEVNTTEQKVSGTFTCSGRPFKTTECKVVMQKGKLNVPYTMKLNHLEIPNCTCESKGIWTGVQTYNIGQIINETDRNCAKPTVKTTQDVNQRMPEIQKSGTIQRLMTTPDVKQTTSVTKEKNKTMMNVITTSYENEKILVLKKEEKITGSIAKPNEKSSTVLARQIPLLIILLVTLCIIF